MPDNDSRSVEDRLRDLATRLEEAAPPLTAADVTERRAESVVLSMRRRHPLLAAGSAALAVAAAVAGFVVIAGNDEPNRVDTADRPGPSTPTSTPTETSLPDGTAGVLPKPADGADAPPLLVWNGEEMALIDYSGKEFSRAPLGGWGSNRPDLGADLIDAEGGWKPAEAPAVDDYLEGCQAVHGRGGILVAACGGLGDDMPSEIRLVNADGSIRMLTGPRNPEYPDIGHWRYALPSPDGKLLLAQWSGECEVPTAYAIEVATGRVDLVAQEGTDSHAIGWAPDGRAVVGISGGPCTNSEFAGTGIYLVDPARQVRNRIHDFAAGATVGWAGYGVPVAPDNRLERRVARARDELGLEGCCGEPNHGKESNSDGVVFEGAQVEIYAVPPSVRLEPTRPGQVRFVCGQDTYTLGVFDNSDASTRPLVQRATDKLRSRLYCTAGP